MNEHAVECQSCFCWFIPGGKETTDICAGCYKNMLGEVKEVVKEARAVAYSAPELNMSNYGHDEVAALNSSMCEIFSILDEA